MDDKVKANLKLVLIIALIAVFVVVAGMISINAAKAYQKPLKNLVTQINNSEEDISVLAVSTLPKPIAKDLKSTISYIEKGDAYLELEDNIAQVIRSLYTALEEKCGDNYKVSYSMSGKEKLDEDALSQISEKYSALYSDYMKPAIELWDSYDKYDYEDLAASLDISSSDAKKFVDKATKLFEHFEEPKIDAGYEVRVKFTAKGSEDKISSERYTFNVIKYEGKWTIDYLSLIDALGLENSEISGIMSK